MKGFVRPDVTVLSEGVLIPEQNLVSPAPTEFTHEVTRATPFFFAPPSAGSSPSGELPAETKVVLLSHGEGDYSRVVDQRGLSVLVERSSLRAL